MQIEHSFTALAFAFALAACRTPGQHVAVPHIGSAIHRNQGLIKTRAWNANLSFKTAQKLKQQGIL